MSMYEHISLAEPSISIGGIEFYPITVSIEVPVAYRELKRTPIMNGTQYVSFGDFIPRKFSFDTVISVNPEKPDEFNSLLSEKCMGVCEVVSLDLGSFKAFVTFSATREGPDSLQLSFNVEEVSEGDM